MPLDGTKYIFNSWKWSEREEVQSLIKPVNTCVVVMEALIVTDYFLMRISFHNTLVLINCPVNL